MAMELVTFAPVALGAVRWVDAGGATNLTVIVKATFELRHGAAALLVQPYPLFGDLPYEENEGRSLRIASDFAPSKPRADVLVTGTAYAPPGERVTHRTVRLAVARDGRMLVDKKLLVVGPRDRDRSGTPTPPAPFAHLPVRYELAYGGAASRDNPVGVGADPGDTRLPSIVDPENPKRAVGLGALPAWWEARAAALRGADPAGLSKPIPVIPPGLDLAYFNAAPADQQTDMLRGDEALLLAGLHPAFDEVQSRLPGTRAHARLVLGRNTVDVPLSADTLWIDGDLLRCTMTWRGAVAVAEAEVPVLHWARVLATVTHGREAPSWQAPAHSGPGSPPAPLTTTLVMDGASSQVPRSSAIQLELEQAAIFAPASDKPPRIPPRVTPHVPVVNATTLPVWTMPWQVRPPEHALVVVAKATFLMGEDGALTLSGNQDPPSGDVFFDADEATPHGSSLRYPSDFAIFKPAADVLLVGHAYSPDPASGVAHVELRVGELRRRVAVFGDRRWGSFGFEGRPARFEKMPLRWERAMGGPLSDANPIGRGYKTGILAPNLERPEALVKTAGDRPAPACFGPAAPHWKPRRAKLGTYDGSWLRERWPYFPADFDWSYFNSAPAEQQVAYLRGDERFSLRGVRPGGAAFEGALTGLRPRVYAQRTEAAGGSFFEVSMRLDTAWFDTDEKKVVLVWRGLFPTADEDAPDIAALFVDGDAQLPLEKARGRLLARVAASAVVPVAELAFPDEPQTDAGEAPPPSPPPAMTRDQVMAKLRAGGLAGLDLTGARLAQLDLSGADLSGAILARADLSGAKLDRAKLAGAVLTGARAEGASFRGADLTGADMTGARLRGASFEAAVLSAAVLDGVRATGATFARASGDRVSFVGARLDDANLDGANLPAANLSRASVVRASFRAASLDDVRLLDARASAAVFEGASMRRARADHAVLTRATLSAIDAPGSVWESADLTGASLQGAKLPEALFIRATLDDALLNKATATGASFRRASLKRARCMRANLMNAGFERADLTEADLRGANLYQAETWRAKTARVDLATANVSGTKLSRAR